MAFQTYECANCGDEFKAYEDANATQGPSCSPRCQTEANA